MSQLPAQVLRNMVRAGHAWGTPNSSPGRWRLDRLSGLRAGAFTAPAYGRPRRTCSNACRQAAHRQHRKLLQDEARQADADHKG